MVYYTVIIVVKLLADGVSIKILCYLIAPFTWFWKIFICDFSSWLFWEIVNEAEELYEK